MDFKPHAEQRLTIAFGSLDEFGWTARAVRAEAHATAIQERRDDVNNNGSRRFFEIAETLGAAVASASGAQCEMNFDADEMADIHMSVENAASEVSRRQELYAADDTGLAGRHATYTGLAREWGDAARVAVERYEAR